MSELKKYGRSLHAPISLGTTSDDRFMPKGFLQYFADLDNLTLTEKLDGQNNCFKSSGVYARSHTSPTEHPWDRPMRERWELIKNDLGDIEIFGENMYGIHSIEYKDIDSYYYVFGVRELDRWLSWEEVKFYAEMFDFPTVPEIEINNPLKNFLIPGKSEDDALREFLADSLGMDWEAYTDTSGLLGGFDPGTGKSCSEGFVIRNSDSYDQNEGSIKVAGNEFNNLFKLVRAKHVKTDVHWTKTWKPAKLTDYYKHNWGNYQYLNFK